MKKSLPVVFLFFMSAVGQAQTKLLDSLQRVVAKHQRDTIEVLALDNISGEYMRNDPEKAKHYAHLAISLAKSLGYDNGVARSYATLIAMHQDTGLLDSAQYY